MMNKKAIAAFAAGATLLAGFAMATPAFAADSTKKEPTVQEQNLANAQAQLATANETLKTKKAALEKDNGDIAAYKKLYPNLNETGLKEQAEKDAADNSSANKTAAEAYKTANTNLEKDTKAVTDAQAAVDAAKKLVEANAPKGEDPSDADYTAALQATSTKLKAADKNVRDAFAKANKLYGQLKAAKAKFTAADKAVTDFNNEHSDDMSKRDRATLGRLEKAKADAEAAKDKLQNKFDEADGKLTEAFGKYNTAFADYADAYGKAKDHKEALVLGFSAPEAVKLLDTDFQYGVGYVGSSDEVTNPGAPAGQPGAAQPGKPGAPAAGANGAAGKAGSKTEVENKNGKDKRGNTHTGTGVGVTLTALAATMLAGMGAAVRKARH